MNGTKVVFYAASMLLPVAAMGAPNQGICAAGTLVDVQADTEMVQTGTFEHGRAKNTNGKREYDSYSTTSVQKQTTYTVVVRLEDMVYTAQSQAIFGFGFKPTAFVINDAIEGCRDRNTLALTRPDGKQYKARIVRAARDPQATPGSAAVPR